jgi:very-short-patch-repair endonuclease
LTQLTGSLVRRSCASDCEGVRRHPLKTSLARELRKDMTYTEVRLWLKLKGRRLDGWKFRRQTPIGPYIVDFYCPAARLVIELNGSTHWFEDQFDRDQRRKRWLQSQGYRVLTFAAESPEQDYLDGVWDTIQLALERVPVAPPPALRATSPLCGEDI